METFTSRALTARCYFFETPWEIYFRLNSGKLKQRNFLFKRASCNTDRIVQTWCRFKQLFDKYQIPNLPSTTLMNFSIYLIIAENKYFFFENQTNHWKKSIKRLHSMEFCENFFTFYNPKHTERAPRNDNNFFYKVRYFSNWWPAIIFLCEHFKFFTQRIEMVFFRAPHI